MHSFLFFLSPIGLGNGPCVQGWEFAHSLIFGERPERIVYKTYEKYDFSQIVLSELLIYHERNERNAHLS